MTTKEIAHELAALCNQGKYGEVYEKFYHPDAYSEEPMGDMRRVEGMEAFYKKGEWWRNTFEVHDGRVGEAIVADDYFALTFYMDITNKETGVRTQSTEIAVYEMKDGKIAGERFFYK